VGSSDQSLAKEIPALWEDYEIFDAHIHIGDYFDINASFPAAELFSYLTRYNIKKAALSAVTKDIAADNELVADALKRDASRIVALAHVDPTAADAIERVDRAASSGFRGLKLHPHYDAYMVFDSRITFGVLERAAKHRMAVLVHTGTPPMTTPMHIGYLAQHFPEVNFIAGHMGLVDSSLEVVEAGRMAENLFMDTTAASVTLGSEDASNRLGAHRFVWGTDAPYLNFISEFFKLLSLRVDDEVKRQILWQNPRTAYRI